MKSVIEKLNNKKLKVCRKYQIMSIRTYQLERKSFSRSRKGLPEQADMPEQNRENYEYGFWE